MGRSIPKHKNGYLEQWQRQQEARDLIVKMWTTQITLDVMAGVLNDLYGFGKDRLTTISLEFNRRFPEYLEALTRSPESDYIRDKIDRQQRRIFGPDYLPWAERYEYWVEDKPPKPRKRN